MEVKNNGEKRDIKLKMYSTKNFNIIQCILAEGKSFGRIILYKTALFYFSVALSLFRVGSAEYEIVKANDTQQSNRMHSFAFSFFIFNFFISESFSSLTAGQITHCCTSSGCTAIEIKAKFVERMHAQ